jgi:tRNA pseudouridine55 synthase
MTPGIHLLHKPVGPTSFSLVQAAIKSVPPEHKAPRICHGGTLDPFASGLLLILVEPATRLFNYLHDIPKTYQATVRWGVETDNGDPHGQVTFTGEASGLTPEKLESALAGFIGWHDQVPHPTSAKRIDGERAYVRAHRGETVIMPPTRVYLHEARWLSHDLPNTSRLELVCRGGYYVRALARDLGKLMGCGAHLTRSFIARPLGPGRIRGRIKRCMLAAERFCHGPPRDCSLVGKWGSCGRIGRFRWGRFFLPTGRFRNISRRPSRRFAGCIWGNLRSC